MTWQYLLIHTNYFSGAVSMTPVHTSNKGANHKKTYITTGKIGITEKSHFAKADG